MPLFRIDGQAVTTVTQRNFATEKALQTLVEKNIKTMFGCQFVASEFPTGEKHGGRIDTLALSEDGNPVIIEYKKEPSSDLINQSLFYLSWITDHRGDFEMAAIKALGAKAEIDWSDVRVICLAPSYRKYDLHAVTMMGANIELWQYRYFSDGALYLEQAFQQGASTPGMPGDGEAQPRAKGRGMADAGSETATTRPTPTYDLKQHEKRATPETAALFSTLRERVLGLDTDIDEVPKKLYVAYRVAQNFLCVDVQKKQLLLFLKLDPASVVPFPENARDVRDIGHYGTGDLELKIRNLADVEAALPLIARALSNIGE